MEWSEQHPRTPDGRHFVVRDRLWRLANPLLPPEITAVLVSELMAARQALRGPRTEPDAVHKARLRVDAAKQALGERGSVWWTDGAPDFNQKMAVNTPYADWYALQSRNRGRLKPRCARLHRRFKVTAHINELEPKGRMSYRRTGSIGRDRRRQQLPCRALLSAPKSSAFRCLPHAAIVRSTTRGGSR